MKYETDRCLKGLKSRYLALVEAEMKYRENAALDEKI